MSVSNGQPANETTFNNAFVSKTANSTVTGQITLSRPGSGASIADAQNQINTNSADIATNIANIATNTANIATNTSAISTLNGQVSTLITDLDTAESQIASNTAALSAKVDGAASSLDDELALFSGTTGKVVKQSSVLISQVATLTGAQTLTNKNLDADQNTITNIEDENIKAAAGIAHTKMAALSADRAMVTNPSGFSSASLVTATELGHLSGVTAGVQSQLNSRVQSSLLTTRGDLFVRDATQIVRLPAGPDNLFLRTNSSLPTGLEWASVTPSLSVLTRTSAYTLTSSDDFVAANATTAAFTLTLPTAVGASGKQYILKKTDATFNAVTIATTASQTIDGATTTTLNTQNECLRVVSDGANWQILERLIPQVWTQYAPTLVAASGGASKGATSLDRGFWMRQGSSILIRFEYRQTGAGVAGTGHYNIGIPSGLTVDTAQVFAFNGTAAGAVLGVARLGANIGGGGNPNASAFTWLSGNTTFGVAYEVATESIGAWGGGNYPLTSPALYVFANATMPITGWRG